MSHWMVYLPIEGFSGMNMEVPAHIDRLEKISFKEYARAFVAHAKALAREELLRRGGAMDRLYAWKLKRMKVGKFMDEIVKRFNANRPAGTDPIPLALARDPYSLLRVFEARGVLLRRNDKEEGEGQ